MQTSHSIKPPSLSKISKLALLLVVGSAMVAVAFFRTNSFQFTRSQIFKKNDPIVIWDTIQKGIALLKTSPHLEYEEGVKEEVALAIYDRVSDRLFEERIWITPQGELLSTSMYPVTIRWWNSFNSFYEIRSHPEFIVVANKFLVERKYLPEQSTLQLDASAPSSKYTDMVYAPYSEYIHQPDVVAHGKKYIEIKSNQAFDELRRDRVESQSSPGTMIADVIPKSLVQNLILVEHVDPSWLSVADDGGKILAERTLVIIGANQEWAYRYTNSSAGANGISQFIPSTYDEIVKIYPSAHLIKDHKLGMADHVNAFKAMVLLLDHDRLLIGTSNVTPEMLAAAYNGGTSRVIRAIRQDGQQWADSDIFPKETTNYVKKYSIIKNLRIFE